jgi:integrase
MIPPNETFLGALQKKGVNRRRFTLVLLAAATGLRTSELLGLTWGDIDWEGQTIHLNCTWLGYVGDGKTPESREPAAMGARMTDFLRTWHRETPLRGGYGLDISELQAEG